MTVKNARTIQIIVVDVGPDDKNTNTVSHQHLYTLDGTYLGSLKGKQEKPSVEHEEGR